MANNVLIPSLGLKNISDVIGAKQFAKDKYFPYSGLWVCSGPQGSGKTLLMMHFVRTIHEMYPKALIISDMHIFGIPYIPYTGIDDFEKYNNGKDGIIFVFDEIQLLFNSLESKNMPLSTMDVWCQNRKNIRLILGTSQRYTRIAKGAREQVTWNIECRRALMSVFYSFRILDGANYDDSGKYIIEDSRDIPKRHFYVPSLKTMTMYNTLQTIKRI